MTKPRDESCDIYRTTIERRRWSHSIHGGFNSERGEGEGIDKWGKKADKERILFGRCMYLGGRGDDSTHPGELNESEVRDRGSGAGGWIHGCRVRKGGLGFFLCGAGGGSLAVGWWRCCLHWDGCETASLPCLLGALTLLYNYRCTDTATVIILFIPIMADRCRNRKLTDRSSHIPNSIAVNAP